MKPFFLFIFLAVIAVNATGQVRPEKRIPTPPGAENMVKLNTDVAIINDIAASFDQMEAAVEVMFARLMKEAHDNKRALEDQVKNIDHKIDSLKDAIIKLEQQLAAEERKRDALASERNGLLQRWRFDLFQSILALTTAIADAQHVIDEIQDKIDAINREIKQLNEDKKALVAQIKQVDAEMLAIEKDKQKALEELRKQKEKAVKQGNQLAVEEKLNELSGLLNSTMNTIVIQLDSLHSVKRYKLIR